MTAQPPKKKRFYQLNRQAHLYLGIAISPFLLIFAITTILLNHGVKPSPSEDKMTVPIQLDDSLEGKELVADVLSQLNLSGEVIGNGQARNGHTIIRVMRPGSAKFVNVDFEKKEALITDRSFGFMDTMRYLHLNPGPHKSPTWILSKMWGWVADSTVYVTLILTLTGIYMWTILRAERKAGLVALGSGAFAFFAIIYGLIAL
jgi:hypothetical protein